MSSYRDIPAAKWKRILGKEKRIVFVTSVDFNHSGLWDAVVAHGICTKIQMENMRANHKSATSQASAFLSHLERRSDRDYYKFFDALKSMDMYDTLLKLTGFDLGPSESNLPVEPAYNYPTPSINRPYPRQNISTTPIQATSEEAPNAFANREPEPATTLPEPHICPPTGPNIHVPGVSSEETVNMQQNLDLPVDERLLESTPVQESLNNNSSSEIEVLERGLSEIVLSDAFGLQPVNVIKTERGFFDEKHETVLLNSDETEEFYPMALRERGHVLIINNKDFSGRGEDSTRTGTDVDADKLEQLWTQLHFRTITYNNLNSQQILLAVQQFAASQPANGQACVIYILTHGKAGQVLGVDNKEVFIDEVFAFFDNERCEVMRGKPKLFFFQACQGDRFDQGIVYADGPTTKTDMVHADVDPYGTTRKPKMTDFLVGYPTLEGYRSFRSGETGSWYIQAMVKIFAKYAGRCDIVKLLTMVNKKVSQQVGRTEIQGQVVNATQMPNYNSALTKDLYFFPGIVEN